VNAEHYRRRLLALEQELLERLARDVETARVASDDQAAAGDLAHVDELKDNYFALAETDSAILARVRAALARIDEGTFGRCVVDGGEIEPQRLQAVPWTPFCLKHQQQLDERLRMRAPSL
jgi:RNA polymerase-binding transcription factor DksA